MIISPPFLPQSGLISGDETDTDPMMTAAEKYEPGYHGVFPVTFDRRWHSGIHLVPETLNEPVRAVADGEVVAYRISQSPISDGHIDEVTGAEALNTNTGFVLLRHVTDTGDGRTLTFYSLYMHLLDLTAQQSLAGPPANPPQNSSPTALAAWLLEAADGVKQGHGRKIYRKDILGHWGQSQGLRHLHFEIFVTGDDFTAWFEQPGHEVQLGEKNPVQPTSKDWWGHAYYVIPGSVQFLDLPDGAHDSAHFPALSRGNLPKDSSKLYVEAYFHKGQRYTRAWLDGNGDGNLVLLTPQPLKDQCDDYEYKLYERAMALYPACPSDGYELLRFGRILSDTPTLTPVNSATWVAVPFDVNGTQGYVDISRTSVVKLSDADFPFFTGWKKIDSENAPLDANGLFSYRKLRQLVGDATATAYEVSQTNSRFSLDQQVSDYVRGNDGVRDSLAGFVCHTVSEWDPANNDQRYQDLNKPDGYFGRCKDTDPDGYERFVGFLKKVQFMDQVPSLAGGMKFWFFHPLAFIRHFRKCGWLSANEVVATFPKFPYYVLVNGAYQAIKNSKSSTLTSEIAMMRIKKYILDINYSMRKYGISAGRSRQAQFLSQVLLETDHWNTVKEYGDGKYNPSQPATKYYAAFYGRGALQLTWAQLYDDYGTFMRLPNNTSGVYADPRITKASTHWFEDPRQKSISGAIKIEGHPKLWFPRYDPQTIVNSPKLACDGSAFFWIYKHHNGARDINRVADFDVNSATISRVSILVNGGGNGYYERQAYGAISAQCLCDIVEDFKEKTITPPKHNISIVVDMENLRR